MSIAVKNDKMTSKRKLLCALCEFILLTEYFCFSVLNAIMQTTGCQLNNRKKNRMENYEYDFVFEHGCEPCNHLPVNYSIVFLFFGLCIKEYLNG